MFLTLAAIVETEKSGHFVVVYGRLDASLSLSISLLWLNSGKVGPGALLTMTSGKEWRVAEPYLHIKCEVGEAPFYSRRLNQFRFLDIPGNTLHLVDLGVGLSSLRTLHLGTTVSVTADVDGDDEMILVGAKSGFAKFQLRTGNQTLIKQLWDPITEAENLERFRLNDGAIDSHGRFFAGALNDPKVVFPSNEGVLFRLDPDLSLHRVLENLAIPNGIGWNANEDTMYLTETLSRKIYAFDYSPSTGTISNQRVFVHLDAEEGAPDGLTVDAEDHVWSAMYGCGKILRISPKGEVVGVVRLPTRCVTCAAFVGQDLFVTSGSDPFPESSDFPQSRELGGSVFKVHVGVEGRTINKWKGPALKNE